MVIRDIGNDHFQQGQEDALRRFGEVVIFLGRRPDDGGGKDGVAAMGDGSDVHNRIPVRHGVVTGVIAERPFEDRAGPERFAVSRVVPDVAARGAHIPFDYDLAVGRHPQRYGLSTNQRNTAAVEEPRHQQFAHTRR